MASILEVNPLRSRQSGNIDFKISGTGFLTDDYSLDFAGITPSFYSDISLNGGLISQNDGLTLSVAALAQSKAGILFSRDLPDCFGIEVPFIFEDKVLPSYSQVKIISCRAEDITNSDIFFEVSLSYSDKIGYYLETSGRLNPLGSIESMKQSINPISISALKIVRTDKRFYGYARISDQYFLIDNIFGYSSFVSNISIYSQNAAPALAEDYTLKITGLNLLHTVSLADHTTSSLTVSDVEISGKTILAEINSGRILVGFPDASTVLFAESFAYTTGESIDKYIRNFDTILSIFNYSISPTRSELFSTSGGFVWDKSYWANSSIQNKKLVVPSLWDPTTANLPEDYFQSGYGFGDGIKLKAIEKSRQNSTERWLARLHHGTYFVKNIPYYLYSAESIVDQLDIEKTEDGRSIYKMRYLPKVGVPISASILKKDSVSGLIVDQKRIYKRGRFTGRVQNGIELETTVLSNIDKEQLEFIVKYNSSYLRENWKVPTTIPLAEKATVSFSNIRFSTKNFTSNFNNYSIQFINDVVAGNERIDLLGNQILIHIEEGVSTTQKVVDLFNDVFNKPSTIEVLKIVCPEGAGLIGKRFLLDSIYKKYYVLFTDGNITDPGIPGRETLEVSITSSFTATDVALSLQGVLDQLIDYRAVSSGDTIIVNSFAPGIVNDPQDIDSGCSFEIIIQGSDELFEAVNLFPPQVNTTDIYCLPAADLNGKALFFSSTLIDYCLWFNTGGAIAPSYPGRTNIEVILNPLDNDNVVASTAKNTINALGGLTCTSRLNILTIANNLVGVTTPAIDVDTGMQIVTRLSGADNTYEQVTVAKKLKTIYSFTLPSLPLKEFPVIFSRKDIFITKKFIAKKYNEGIYSAFYYGEGIEDNGDFAIDYTTGIIYVCLDQDYIDLGYITYAQDYPAVIEFNNDYIIDYGSSILNPTMFDLDQLNRIAESTGEPRQEYTVKEFPILDFSTNTLLDRDNFHLFLYDSINNTFDTGWTRVVSFEGATPTDSVYTLNPERGLIKFGDGVNGKIPPRYSQIVAGYKRTVRIEYEPISSVDYWVGKNTDLNLNKNSLNSGFVFLSRKNLVPANISLAFTKNNITALDYTDLKAIVTDIDGEPIPGLPVSFEILSGYSGGLESPISVTDFNGEAVTTYLPSGNITDLGTYIQLFDNSGAVETPGDAKTGIYFSSSSILPNNMLISDELIQDIPGNIYIFKILDDGDAYAPYNNITRTGGTYQVLYRYNPSTGRNELLKPKAISGKVLIFEQSLPQPFDSNAPYYEPNLRGFVIIGKKVLQAKANIQLVDSVLTSDVATLKIEYSPIQKDEWTLPVLPVTYTGSEISRATYIQINPSQHEFSFTQAGDTDTITLAHNTVNGFGIQVLVNNKEYKNFQLDKTTNPNKLKWDQAVIKNGDTVKVRYLFD